jgi:2-polyprenyl-3-methyl-5-hydroxy-6-metoxy-1,4-benzoquinol methylase
VTGPDPARSRARIVEFGRARLPERPECSNIASAIGVAQYLAIAREVATVLGEGRILDWGAGWGQASLLLRAHGLDVVAFDVEDKGAASGLLAGTDIPYVVAPGPFLPFADGAFEAVLNCGVLEHVEDERGALAELRRILKPRGWLFTYHLPNRHAYTEWLGRRLGRVHHDRTYTRAEAVGLLERAGFHVRRCRPFHLLPRNVWGRSPGLAAVAGPLSRGYEVLDAALLHLPGVARLGTAWAVLAQGPE